MGRTAKGSKGTTMLDLLFLVRTGRIWAANAYSVVRRTDVGSEC